MLCEGLDENQLLSDAKLPRIERGAATLSRDVYNVFTADINYGTDLQGPGRIKGKKEADLEAAYCVWQWREVCTYVCVSVAADLGAATRFELINIVWMHDMPDLKPNEACLANMCCERAEEGSLSNELP